jgi:ketosteroid isomerase-like protein
MTQSLNEVTQPGDLSPKAVAERFLSAMSRLDIDAVFEVLADDVVCSFPTAPGGPQEIRGRDTNRAFYTTTIRPMIPTFSLTRVAVHPLADDPERVVAEFASEGSLVDGVPYRNTYLALVTVRDGKIARYQEFSDPAPLQRGVTALQAAGQSNEPASS